MADEFLEQSYTQKLAMEIVKTRQAQVESPGMQSVLLQLDPVELSAIKEPQLGLQTLETEGTRDDIQTARDLSLGPTKIDIQGEQYNKKLEHAELGKRVSAGIISNRIGGNVYDIGRLLFDAENKTDYRDAGISMALGVVPVNELYKMKEKIAAGRASGAYLDETISPEKGRNIMMGAVHEDQGFKEDNYNDMLNYAAFLPVKPYNPTHFENIEVDEDATAKQLLHSITNSIPAELVTSFGKDFSAALRSSSLLQLRPVQEVARLIVTANEPQYAPNFNECTSKECIYGNCMRLFIEKYGSDQLLSQNQFTTTDFSRSYIEEEVDNMLLCGKLKALQTVSLKEAIDLMKEEIHSPYKHKNTDVEIAYMASMFGTAISNYIEKCETEICEKRSELYKVFQEHQQNQKAFNNAIKSISTHNYIDINCKGYKPINDLTSQQMQRTLNQYDIEVNKQLAEGVELPPGARKPATFLDKKKYDPLTAVQRLCKYTEALSRINDSDHLLSFFSEYHEANTSQDLDPRISIMVLNELASTHLFLHPLECRDFKIAPLLDEVLEELDLSVTGENPFKILELESYTKFLSEGVALPLGDNGTAAQLVEIWEQLKVPIMERLDLFSILSHKDTDIVKITKLIELWQKEILICNEIQEKLEFIQEFCKMLENYYANTASLQQLEARKTKLWNNFRELQRAGTSLRNLAADAKQETGMQMTYSGLTIDEYIKTVDKTIADCKANMPSNLFLTF